MYKLPSNIQDYSYQNIPDIITKSILLRSSLDIAIDEDGNILEETRIHESMTAISELANSARNLIILGHLGRPEKREEKYSLKKVAEVIKSNLDGFNIELIAELDEVNVDRIKKNNINESKIIFLIENIRFFKGEESEDSTEKLNFAKQLANLGDVFVNDSFSSYRKAVSTYDIATLLPSYIGPSFLAEIHALQKIGNPEKPFIAVLGGAKLSEKLDAMKSLCQYADKVLVGGAMAYTLMKAKGFEIGRSLFEEDKLEVAKEIINQYEAKILLPIDHITTAEFKDSISKATILGTDILDDHHDKDEEPYDIAIDIGGSTIRVYETEIAKAKTILWNGPMGVFEWENGYWGTKWIAKAIENSTAYKIAGGGDTIAAINKFDIKNINHISTGGGAMLTFLAYDEFPTLDVILKNF